MKAADLHLPEGMEVYVDMDGVIADFFTEYAKLAGVKSGNYRDIPPAKADPTLDKMVGTDFFFRLPKFPTADKLLDIVVDAAGSYKICSSPLRGDHENSGVQKRRWIQKNLHVQPKEIIITRNKAKYAKSPKGLPNALIDGRGSNITSWEAAGGIGIKYQADEDSLRVILDGLKRARRVAKGEQDHEPQQLVSKDRGGSNAIATAKDESIREDYHPHQKKVEHFIKWVYKKLNLHDPLPEIIFSNNTKLAKSKHRTGYFNKEKNVIYVYTGHRNLVDIFRTLAHEMTHEKQGEEGRIHGHSPPGSPNEMDADSKAGYLMKLYTKSHPEIIDGSLTKENFADGKGPGRPGDSQRHGIPKKATMAELEKASHAKGRKGQLARWQINMRRGHKK